jgi:outer membrane protein, heavy metal efflux system
MRRARSLLLPLVLGLSSLLAQQESPAAGQNGSHWKQFVPALAAGSPTLEAARNTLEAARQRAPQAGSLPDPMVGLSYRSMPSPLPFQGIGRDIMATAGLMVSQEFPARGVRKLRYQIARTEADAEQQSYEQLWNSLVGELQRTWLDLRYAWDALDLLEENETLVDEVLRATEARYAIGEASQDDLLRAQTQLSLIATRRERLLQTRRVTEARLQALLAQEAAALPGRPAAMPLAELPGSPETMLAALPDTSPLMHRAAARIQARNLGVNLARKGYQPGTRVSGAYMNRGGLEPMWEVNVEFSVPAWFRTKQRPEVAERSSELAAARREYEATLHALSFEVREQFEAARTAERMMRIYEDTLIPQARLRVDAAMARYESAEGSFLSLFEGLMADLEYRMSRLEERRNFEVAVSRLGELTGKELLP